jgi:hypothetical protein
MMRMTDQAGLFPETPPPGPTATGTAAVSWRSIPLPGGRLVRLYRVADTIVLTTAWPEDPVLPVTGGIAVPLAAVGELADAIQSLIAEHTDGTRA